MIFHVIVCILATSQNWVKFFEKSLKQNGDNDYIFHSFKPERAVIQVWLKSSQHKQWCQIASITCTGSL